MYIPQADSSLLSLPIDSALGIPRSRMTQTPCRGRGNLEQLKIRRGIHPASKGDNYSSLMISWLLGRSWLATTDWDYDHYTNNYWWFLRFIPFVTRRSDQPPALSLKRRGVTPRLLNGDGLQFVSELETAQTRADAMCLGACPIQQLMSLGNCAWFFLI